jgi:predicted DNA-binding transcriptional regulator AlpA
MEIRTALYRLYDAQGALLYVGISGRPLHRVQHHRAKTAWGPEIATTTIEWLGTRQEALRAETRAIATEGPLHNVALNQARAERLESTLPVRLGLVASAEISAILGVSRQRVHQITKSHSFPAPIAELVSATIWLESDVRAWAKRTGRKVAA